MTSDYSPLHPEAVAHVSKKREYMAAVAFLVSMAGFVLQTEVLSYVSDLGYQKPMFVMYVTHSCMMLLLPLQILSLWIVKWIQRRDGFMPFYSKHTLHLRRIAVLVAELNGSPASNVRNYFIKIGSLLAVALNVAGASWYIAVNMTTTADLTAIYNCSTFFAYGFSVLLLKERLNMYKCISVILSIIGVFIIAYMGLPHGHDDASASSTWGRRSVGNTIIAAGTVLYGLYEVLYKKVACPPQKVSAKKQAAFANFVGALIGVGTLVLMAPLLVVLHVFGIETFELPSVEVLKYLIISIVGNVSFSGAFLVLMSLTSPVLGSLSSLLATCVVPIINFIIWRQGINFAEIFGGIIIIGAFGLMSWASLDDFVEQDDDDST